ncbi:maestro heat-like repeat-containing protein family member 1 [Lissotriton helveticus]
MSGPLAPRNKRHKPRQNGRGGKISTAATLISKLKQSAVRLMESIWRMDVNILMAFLHTSASANSNENILLCCKILEHRKKLTLQQELTIVHCMYTTITQREVTMSNMLVTADTLDSILTDSENSPEVERMALICQISLTKWIPQSISSKIVNLFTVPSIPEEIVFWAIHQMTIQYGPEMEPYLDLILRTLFPVMKTASTINQKYWFSLVIEMLSGQFASSVDTPLVTLFFEAYSTCKVFLLETIPSLQEVWGQVITTLGHLASILPEEQLDKELPWLVNEVERLQPQLPADMAFRLLTTLELCIKAAVTKSCRALNGTVPTVLAVLHHLICTPSSGVSDETEEPLKLSTAIILSLAHSHSSEVHKYFESSLMQIGAESRATTLQLLCKLLSETDSEGAFYLDAVRHVLEDDNRKVILATLSLMSSLTAKGFYDVNGRAVMDYVLKKTSLLIKEQGISHMDPESDVEEETIHIQMFQLLNKIALRHKNTDEGFWKEILSYMLEDDYTSSVPALCQMLLVVDKKASINFHECAKEIPIHRLFIRLLVISSYPRWDVERGTSVLALLARLIPANYPFLAKLLRKKIPPLITYLEG